MLSRIGFTKVKINPLITKIITFSMLFILSIFLLNFYSCNLVDLDGEEKLGGVQSEFGEVGNTIDWTAGQFGISDIEMEVTSLEDGVSTFTCKATASNSTYIDMLKMVPTERIPGSINIVGNTVEASVNAIITSEGMQAVFEDGRKFTLVKYDAKVGDVYKTSIGGVTLENEVTEKSTEDDYYWQGILIKVIVVKYKSHAPGINYVEHVYNHRFGLVGLAIYFEDGTVKYAGAVC